MSKLFNTSALIAIFAASPALAEITPADAWDIWQAQADATGLTVTSQSHAEGDALVIDRVRISVNMPEAGLKGFLEFSGPRLEPVGEGNVRMTFPETDSYVLAVKGSDAWMDARFQVVADGYVGIMSGTPGSVTTAWSANGIDITLGEVVLDGEQVDRASATFSIGQFASQAMTNINETHVSTEVTASYSGMEYDFSMNATEEDSTAMIAAGQFGRQTSNMSLVLPRDGIDVLNLPTQLREGMYFAGTGNIEDLVSSQQTIMDGAVFMEQASNVRAETFSMRLSSKGLDYGASGNDVSVQVSMPEMGLDADVSLKAVSGSVFLPLLKADEQQSVNVAMMIEELAVNDAVWDLADPQGRLSRDLVNVSLDMSGSVIVTEDMIEFPEVADLDEPPVQIQSAVLNTLLLDAVGAKLSGIASFVFDNTDLETFDGMPAPTGTAEIRVEGANQLIDSLLAMGLMSEDDAFGARMLMGMIGRAGEGEDVLLSTIEVKGNGEISANGQRLR